MARPDQTSDEAAPPGDDPLAFQVLNEVGILSQLSSNLAARLLAPGLNLSQFILLNHFSRLGGDHSLVQLAGAMQVTKAAMTNTVARLQAKGLLSVQPDPLDGRGKRVSLTPAGLAARQQAVQQLGQGLAAMGSAVSPQDLTAALVALRKLRVWFDNNR
jgi:DNA-binding MarR family transcriptional regulator